MKFAIVELPHTFPQTSDPARLEFAEHWQGEDAHRELREALTTLYDGYAVSVRFGDDGPEHSPIWQPEMVGLWTSHVVPTLLTRRPLPLTEAVIVSSPRLPLFSAPLHARAENPVRPGATVKPRDWTLWVLALLGADPGKDEIVSYFTQEPVTAFDSMLTLENP